MCGEHFYFEWQVNTVILCGMCGEHFCFEWQVHTVILCGMCGEHSGWVVGGKESKHHSSLRYVWIASFF